MLNEWFLLTRAEVDDESAFNEAPKHKEGPKILVNLGPGFTVEPVYDGKSTPTSIAFTDCEVVVMETVEDIEEMLVARRDREARNR